MCRHRLLFVHLGSASKRSDWLSGGCRGKGRWVSRGGLGGGQSAYPR